MKIIIAGSRSLDYSEVNKAMEKCGWIPSLVISGHARGIDLAGEKWAKENDIPIKIFPANWSLGRAAGFMRNIEMAQEAEALVAVWDCKSSGTKHMINTALSKRLKVFIHKVLV